MDNRIPNQEESSLEWKSHRKMMYSHKNEMLANSRRCQMAQRSMEFRMTQIRETFDGNAAPAMTDAFPPGNSPLKNEYMLELIADFLPVQDLRKCRLVCRLFSQEFGRCLDKKTNLIVTDETSANSLRLLSNPKELIPYGLSSLCVFDVQTTGPIFKSLMKKYGKTLAELKLEECSVTASTLKEILFKSAPNLESLAVIEKDCPFNRDRYSSNIKSPLLEIIESCDAAKTSFVLPEVKRFHWEDSRVSLGEIVKMCPNLIELTCGGLPTPFPLDFKSRLRFSSLKYLKIFPENNLSQEYLEALIPLRLPLVKLTLYGIKPQGRTWMIKLKTFLESLGSTLTELQLHQDYFFGITNNTQHNMTTYSDLPKSLKMPQLKILIIDKSLLHSFKWLNGMPNLTNLECKMVRLNQMNDLLARGQPKIHRKLEKLTIGVIGHTFLNSIARFFPSLISLDVESCHADDECLWAIIENFKNLQNLKISKSYQINNPMPLTDAGITGIPRKQCEKLLKLKTNKLAAINPKHVRVKPYIGQLTNLIQLKIQTTISTLTDLSILFGICDMNNLLMLTLPNSKITNATLDCIQQKMKSLALLEIGEKTEISADAMEKLSKARNQMIVRVNPICLA